MTPHPPRQASLKAVALAAALGLAALTGFASPGEASTGPATWTPLGDSADRALGPAGRRSVGRHAQAVRDHLERSPNGAWNTAAMPVIEPFPSLDPATYFTAEPSPGALDRNGLTDAARLHLGRGARVGLDPAEAQRWSIAACHGSVRCANAVLSSLNATLREDGRIAPPDLEHGTADIAQRAALRALYALTVEAAVAAGHLDPDIRQRVLAAFATRPDLPGWPTSRTVLTLDQRRGAPGGPGFADHSQDPVQLAQAVTETANGVMDDALPEADILGGLTLSLGAGGEWRDTDWSEVGYGGDMGTVSMIGSVPLNDRVTFGMASTWEFPGAPGGGWGTTGSGVTAGPFVSLDLDNGLSVHALGTASRLSSDVASWYGYGEGSFTGRRLGATGGLSYGTTEGRWQVGGSAQATWFTQTRDGFTDSAGRENPAATLESGQVALSGRLAYGGDLSAVSPRLEGSFRPWASADALLTGQAPLRPGNALDGPDPVRGRLRLGLDVIPDGGPALSVQGGASGLGADQPGFDARAGLRLKF